MKTARTLVAGLLLTSVTACSTPAPPPEWGEDFEQDLRYIAERALSEINAVPGVGIAVVSGDETIFAGGFGYADLEAGRSVTSQTPFYIASATKPLTALAFARMDAAGVFDLDRTYAAAALGIEFDPVIEADRIRLADMLIHTSGVDVAGLSFRQTQTGEWTPELAWDLLAHSEPSPYGGRGEYGYINAGYNILTTIHEHESGQPWQDAVAQWVSEPLGLEDTSIHIEEMRAAGRLAHGYLVSPGQLHPVRSQFEKTDNMMHSAGGLIMTPADAAIWLELQLNDGHVDGRQIIDSSIMRQSHEQLADISEASQSSFTREGYGLGWFIGDYDDEPVYYSYGSFAGYFANLSWMPSRDLGVAIFTNSNVGSEMSDILATFAYDWHVDPEAAYTSAIRNIQAFRGKLWRISLVSQLQEMLDSNSDYRLSLDLAVYEGSYENEEYGTFDVEVVDDRLRVAFGPLEAIATGFDEDDAVRIELMPQDGTILWFHAEDGMVTRASLFGRRFLRQ